jgi:hypothetical protein
LYTNGPDASYILLDFETEWVPFRKPSNDSQERADTIDGTWPPTAGYIVWYDNIHRDYLLTIDELEDVAMLEPLVTVSDGSIYHVSPIKP